MSCTPAPTCKAALAEATLLFPNRNRASDGICASAQHHQQNPTSDHETGDAFDLTHDPANGCDVDALFAAIIARRDPRVKYLIRNKQMCRAYDKPGIPAWTWAPYTGPNPHIHHGHCSIYTEARNDVSPWFAPQPSPPQEDEDMPIIVTNEDNNFRFLIQGGLRFRLDGPQDDAGHPRATAYAEASNPHGAVRAEDRGNVSTGWLVEFTKPGNDWS